MYSETIYRNKVMQWDKLASVRSRPRKIFDPLSEGYAYPIERQPLVIHPMIKAGGENMVKLVLLHSAYKFMLDIAYVEVELINHTAQRIYNGAIDFGFSPELRLDMLSVVIDEAFHAYVAIDFINQVEAATKIAPIRSHRQVELGYALDKHIVTLPMSAQPAFELMAISIGENTLTKELFSMTKQKELNPFFHQVMADHMIDEGRHSSIFRYIMQYVWKNIDEEIRLEVGKILPLFIKDYLDPAIHILFDRTLLKHIGFNDADILKIINDTHRDIEKERLALVNPVARNIVEVIEQCEILNHKPTYQAFAAARLIDIN